MSKIMSVFEKLNLVEKADQEKVSTADSGNVFVQEKAEVDNVDDSNVEKSEAEAQYFESHCENIETSEEAHVEQNRKYTIEEIYTSSGLENSGINTVFMLGNFIDAIPDSLPNEVRRKSVISIVASASKDLAKLLGDGEKRLSALNLFSRDYYDSTVNAVEGYKKKIEELRAQIKNYEEQIQVNENLLKEQNNIIKYETDKIEGIINFLKNGD